MAVRDRILELRRVKASELAPDPRNPRRHPPAQRRALESLLDSIGYAGALIARQGPRGLELIDGHLRAELDPDQVVPVLVLDVDASEATTLLASLDPLAAMASTDPEALQALLAQAVLPEEILAARPWSLLSPAPGHPDPEEVPARSRRGRVRLGQIWQMGEHRLACADATDPGALRALMRKEKAELLLTDPPYGVSYTGKTPDRLQISGDERSGLEQLLGAAFAAIDEELCPGARIYVFHPAGEAAAVFSSAFSAQGWRHHQTLVWVKDCMVLGRSDYHYRHEPILYGYKPGPGRWGRGARGWYGGQAADSVLECPRPAASRAHPTAKPVALLSRLVQNSSRPGGVVLDPFAGSGSAMISCEQLGRRARLVEIDPSYCEVAISRWEAFTGSRARVADG